MWEIKSAVSCSFLVKEIELHIAWICAIIRWSPVTHVKVLRHRNLSFIIVISEGALLKDMIYLSSVGYHGLITVDDGIAPICHEQFG